MCPKKLLSLRENEVQRRLSTGYKSVLTEISELYADAAPELPQAQAGIARGVSDKLPRSFSRTSSTDSLSRASSRASSTESSEGSSKDTLPKIYKIIYDYSKELRFSQRHANHPLRIKATEAALKFTITALPYGAGNIAGDIFSSGGLSIAKTAMVHEAWGNDYKHIWNVKKIARAAAKFGAGNCIENAAVTFSYLCSLAQKGFEELKGFPNSSVSFSPPKSMEEEMYNAEISRVMTKIRDHHYVVIGDWRNDPENSYVVDSWVPSAEIGLKFSEVDNLKDIIPLTTKKAFSINALNVTGDKAKDMGPLTAPTLGEFEPATHSKVLLDHFAKHNDHIYYQGGRRKFPDAPVHPMVFRETLYPDGLVSLKKAMVKWSFFRLMNGRYLSDYNHNHN